MTQYRQSSAVAWRQIDGEAVLIDPAEGTVFVLNPVGLSVWTLIDEPRELGEIARNVAEEYDIGEERLTDDIRSFLESLELRELIEVRHDS